MIKEDYVSFEVAKLLKEKGFDIPCMGRYSVRSKEFHLDCTKMCNNGGLFECAAPTHQMAMKWLREVHKIQICVEQNPYDVWHYWGFSMSYIDEKINELPNPTQAFIHICPTKIPNNCYKTYEEAVEAALKYSLELI